MEYNIKVSLINYVILFYTDGTASIVVLFRTFFIDNMTFTGIQGIIVFWCCITVCWSYINVQESTADMLY
jgi:hypothetical protein